MKVFVTGIRGFLGAVLEHQGADDGFCLTGVDLDLYRYRSSPTRGEAARDFEGLRVEDLEGYDAVVHLAAISSDEACNLRSDAATRTNTEGAIELARLAKLAGVRRFIFASSCSVYGAAADRISTEKSDCAPISTYGTSKLNAEKGILATQSDRFSPTVLRFATLYGLSPNLRTDLVVNAMMVAALGRGEISVNGSGEQVRPLVHVVDAASAVLDVLRAAEEDVRGRVFNVTDTTPGYSIAQIAELVKQEVPGSTVVRHPSATDRRHYRVDGSQLQRLCRRRPVALHAGLEEIADGLRRKSWQRRASAPEGHRAKRLRALLNQGELNDELRWNRTGQGQQV